MTNMASQGAVLPLGLDASDFKPNTAWKDFVLPVVTNAFFFNIHHCDENGRPDKKYHPHSAMSTCVCNIANVARKMAQTPTTLGGLVGRAAGCGKARPNAWFLQGLDTKEKKIFEAAKKFQGFFEDGFPSVIVDDSMKNRGSRAAHPRRISENGFKLADQCILLNGLSLRHMIAAAIASHNTRDKNHSIHQEYRTWVFSMASCVYHEISHIFITYLSRSVDITPPSIKAHVASITDNDEGEAGRNLEQLVFGGIITFRREALLPTGDKDCGTPYLVTEKGWYRITQKTIKRTVECDFKFPYEHTGIDDSRFDLMPLDFDKPMDKRTHPLQHPDWPKIRDTQFPDISSNAPA